MITFIIIVASLLLINVIATFVVLNTHFEIKERRLYQIIFVWILPYVGGILAILINREDFFESRRNNKIGNDSNISHSDAVSMASSVNHIDGR